MSHHLNSLYNFRVLATPAGVREASDSIAIDCPNTAKTATRSLGILSVIVPLFKAHKGLPTLALSYGGRVLVPKIHKSNFSPQPEV